MSPNYPPSSLITLVTRFELIPLSYIPVNSIEFVAPSRGILFSLRPSFLSKFSSISSLVRIRQSDSNNKISITILILLSPYFVPTQCRLHLLLIGSNSNCKRGDNLLQPLLSITFDRRSLIVSHNGTTGKRFFHACVTSRPSLVVDVSLIFACGRNLSHAESESGELVGVRGAEGETVLSSVIHSLRETANACLSFRSFNDYRLTLEPMTKNRMGEEEVVRKFPR